MQVRIDCGDEPSGDVTTALVTYRGTQCNSTTGSRRNEDAPPGNGPRLIAVGLKWSGRHRAGKTASGRFWPSSVETADSTRTGPPGPVAAAVRDAAKTVYRARPPNRPTPLTPDVRRQYRIAGRH